MNQPIEARIVSALMLQPMDVRLIAECLSIEQATARHRVQYLREAGDVVLHQIDHRGPGRPWYRFTLSEKGKEWARELMA